MDDLRYIKKHYSESLSHICRDLFPTLLETEGLLTKLLEKKFDHSSSLGDDLKNPQSQEKFKNYIYSLIDVEKPSPEIIQTQNAFEIMEKAGYILFPECKTEEEIQSYRHYFYRSEPTPIYNGGTPEPWAGEELCTFNGGRLDYCRVWFAVKKNVDNIKRKDFKNPQRQDDYGTSVISIQFSKTGVPTLSIKNRYNHSVNHPDATFGNNLENIAPGLTRAFAETFSLNLSSGNLECLDLGGYRQAEDGKFYRENYEENNIIYCENNVIIDNGSVMKLNSDYMLLDNYIFDLKNLRIITYETYKKEQQCGEILKNNNENDAFISSLEKIKGFGITKGQDKERTISIKTPNGEDVKITFGKDNRILEVDDPNVKVLKDNYLANSEFIRSFSAQNVSEIRDYILKDSHYIEHVNIPNVKTIKNGFLDNGSLIKEINMPKLKEIGNKCFNGAPVQKINLPKLEKIGDWCFSYISSYTTIGQEFFDEIKRLNQGNMFYIHPTRYLKSLLEEDNFSIEFIKRVSRDGLQSFFVPNLKEIGDYCFNMACYEEFNAPILQQVGLNCFCGYYGDHLQNFSAPNLIKIGKNNFQKCNFAIDFNCGIEIKQDLKKQNLNPQEEKMKNDCILAVKNLQCELLGKKPEYQIINPEQESNSNIQNTEISILKDWKASRGLEELVQESIVIKENTPNQ